MDSEGPQRVALIKPGDCIGEFHQFYDGSETGQQYDSGESVVESMVQACVRNEAPLLIVSHGTRSSSEECDSISLVVLPSDRTLGSRWLARCNKLLTEFRVLGCLSAFRPDMVVSVGPGYRLVLPFLFTILSGARFVPMMVDELAGRSGLVAAINRNLTLAILRSRKVRRILAVTLHLKSEMAIWGVPGHRVTVYSRAYTERFWSRIDDDAPSLLGAFPRVLVVGRLDIQQKGLDMLLDIVPRVLNKRKSTQFLIIGDGQDRAKLERLIVEKRMQENVILMGYKPQAQMFTYLKSAHVVAIPSRHEGVAKAGLESMLAGVPVVAFDSGGIGDYLQDGYNGFLIPKYDLDAFARSLLMILEDEQLRLQLAANAAEVGQRLRHPSYSLRAAFEDLVHEAKQTA